MTGQVGKLSNYPNGFDGGLTLDGVTAHRSHPGKVFYVGDGDTAGATPSFPNRKTPSDGNKGSFLAPYKTGDKAVEQCTAEAGDTIVFLPGYNEAIESASELALDVDGITIIGLGRGDDQASWTYDTETASVLLSAANARVSGMHLLNADASEATAAAIIVSGAGNEISGNRFTNSDVNTNEWVDIIDIEAVANTKVYDNDVEQSNATVAGVSFVALNGVCTDTEVRRNKVSAAFTKAMVHTPAGAAGVNTRVVGNEFISGGVDALDAIPLVDDETATTSGSGVVAHNLVVANIAHGAVVDTAGTEVYFIANNTLASTAGTAGDDGVGQNFMKAFTAVDIETDGDDAIASVESGTVAIWGIWAKQKVVGGVTDKWNVNTEGGVVLQTGVDGSVAAIGDFTYPTETPGGNQTFVEVGGDISANHLWDYPAYVTGDDEIDVEGAEAATGGGAASFTIYYTPVTTGAVIAAAEA